MTQTIKNTMSVKQTLKCDLHSPEKWQDDYNGEDADNPNNLPNYAPVSVYSVDEYSACPDNWEHGSDISGSFFAGLAEDGALWLDFNGCFDHTHDVAIVLSVQGINPITGQTMIGDNPLRMEQYHKKCPIHGCDFKQDYLCEECGFKWPGQNYMSTTGTPYGMFWLDGFRTPDGNVRQYIISAEKMRGVAAQVMKNSEDRVFAIGVALYLSKDKKPDMPKGTPRPSQVYGGQVVNFSTQPMFFSPMHTPQPWNKGTGSRPAYGSPPAYMGSFSGHVGSVSSSNAISSSISTTKGKIGNSLRSVKISSQVEFQNMGSEPIKPVLLSADINVIDDGFMDTDEQIDTIEHIETVTPVKKLEVGAGALVNQRIYDDPKNLKKYWEEAPAGMIYINYCDEETLKRILEGGKKASKKDGFMNGIQVG